MDTTARREQLGIKWWAGFRGWSIVSVIPMVNEGCAQGGNRKPERQLLRLFVSASLPARPPFRIPASAVVFMRVKLHIHTYNAFLLHGAYVSARLATPFVYCVVPFIFPPRRIRFSKGLDFFFAFHSCHLLGGGMRVECTAVIRCYFTLLLGKVVAR